MHWKTIQECTLRNPCQDESIIVYTINDIKDSHKDDYDVTKCNNVQGDSRCRGDPRDWRRCASHDRLVSVDNDDLIIGDDKVC